MVFQKTLIEKELSKNQFLNLSEVVLGENFRRIFHVHFKLYIDGLGYSPGAGGLSLQFQMYE